MEQILFVVFTIADQDIQSGYLNTFFPNLDCNNWQFQVFMIEEQPKIIFINDKGEDTFSCEEKNKLSSYVTGALKCYVLYHRAEKFVDIFSKSKCWSTKDHHDKTGWSFNLLCQLSKQISDGEKFKKILMQFTHHFPDPILEAKLIINKFLHIYLKEPNGNKTKSGAYNYVNEKINEKISGFQLNSLSEEEKKKETWIDEWKKWEKENGNGNTFTNSDDIEALNLFASSNA